MSKRSFLEYLIEDLESKESPQEQKAFLLAAVHASLLMGLEMPPVARHLLDELEESIAARLDRTVEDIRAEIRGYIQEFWNEVEAGAEPEGKKPKEYVH